MSFARTQPGKFFGWKALAVVAVMYFAMTGLLLYSFPVILPFLCQSFGWSRASVSWANSLAMAVMGIASPWVGILIARHGAKKVIAAGGFFCALCFVCASFHTQLWELYLAYAVFFGLGGSACGMLAMTSIANNWFVKKRALALSVLLAAGGLGGVFMVRFIMSMINRFGWRNTYLLIAAMVLGLLVILPALLVVNKPEDMGQVPDGIGTRDKINASASRNTPAGAPADFTASEALKTPAFWCLTVYGTAFMVGLQGFMLHNVAFLIDIKIAPAAAATAYSVFVAVSTIGRLGMGFLGIKYPTRPLGILAMLCMVAGMTMVLWGKTMPMIYACNSLIGFGMGGTYVALMNLMPLYFGRTHYPRIMGYAMPFITIIGSLGSPLTGRILDVTGSYMLAWKLAILILMIGLVSLIFAHPPVHPSVKERRVDSIPG
jgi:MFS transporter, OFA family, oxalate/formate antiporter